MPQPAPIHKPLAFEPRGGAGRSIDDNFYSCAPWRNLRAWFAARHPALCSNPFKLHGPEEVVVARHLGE